MLAANAQRTKDVCQQDLNEAREFVALVVADAREARQKAEGQQKELHGLQAQNSVLSSKLKAATRQVTLLQLSTLYPQP